MRVICSKLSIQALPEVGVRENLRFSHDLIRLEAAGRRLFPICGA